MIWFHVSAYKPILKHSVSSIWPWRLYTHQQSVVEMSLAVICWGDWPAGTLGHLIKWIKSGVNSSVIFFYQLTHYSSSLTDMPMCCVVVRWRSGSRTVAPNQREFMRRRWRSWNWPRGLPCYKPVPRTCRHRLLVLAQQAFTRHYHSHQLATRYQVIHSQQPRHCPVNIIISRICLTCRRIPHLLHYSRLPNYSASFRINSFRACAVHRRILVASINTNCFICCSRSTMSRSQSASCI